MVATRFRIHGDDDPVKRLSSGMPVPFPGGTRRLPVMKRILRTWYGRRRDPSPAWARQTAERSHWLIATSIKANACTVNTNVRFLDAATFIGGNADQLFRLQAHDAQRGLLEAPGLRKLGHLTQLHAA